jgi:hypothetical protein
VLPTGGVISYSHLDRHHPYAVAGEPIYVMRANLRV